MAEEQQKQIDQIYEGDLSLDSIRENPILQPIAEINNSHKNLSQSVQKALSDFESIEKEMDNLIEQNPVYEETRFVNDMKLMISHVREIIHSQDMQIINLKKAIREVINIVGKEYTFEGEEQEKKEEELSSKKDFFNQINSTGGENETEQTESDKEE